MNKIIFYYSIGILLISILPISSSLNISSFDNSIDNDIEDLIKPSFLFNQIEVDLVSSYVEHLTSFGPRVTGSQQCIDAGIYIYHEFEEMGLEVRYHNWSVSSSSFGSNIEATLTGVSPDSNETFIVCAHYDSVYGSPGADDNAAGTAAVLASAAIMSQYSFSHTVKFVTFSGEEQGLIGSNAYAQESYENNIPITGVLNADMIGYASTRASDKKVYIFDNEQSTWITQLAQNLSIRYHDILNLTIVQGTAPGLSDHASFQVRGYDAVFFHEYKFNPHYHSSHDTIDFLNLLYLRNVTRLITGSLIELAEYYIPIHPEKPLTPVGPSHGELDQTYTFSTRSYDENNESLFYLWDWGNNKTSGWIGPFSSGEPCEIQYQWNETETFEIRVKAKDTFGFESEWSDPLHIMISKEKSKPSNLLNSLNENHGNVSFISFFKALLNSIINEKSPRSFLEHWRVNIKYIGEYIVI